jgi:dienelactone hydrolase
MNSYKITLYAAALIMATSPSLQASVRVDTTQTVVDTYEHQGKKVNCVFIKPLTTGKKPAIFFMQGFGCTPFVNLGPTNPQRVFCDYFARNGFVVMRAEKPGMENNAVSCRELDFDGEVDGFKSAYAKLLQMPDVDTGRIIIFGHSMGGMQAPYVASAYSPKGIAVYGITIKNWYEYLLDMLRFQNPHSGVDYVTVDQEMQLYPKILLDILINGQSPRQVTASDTVAKRLLERDFLYEGGEDFIGKHARFSQSLQKANHYQAWKKVNAKVLSIYGEYDIQSAGDFSHMEVVELVNFYHPGNAGLLRLPKTDHSMFVLDNPQEAYDIFSNIDLMMAKRRQGPNPMLLASLLEWMRITIR